MPIIISDDKIKILIWDKNRALGDGIISTGYIRELAKMFPNAQIDLFCTTMNASAFKGNPYVKNIFFFAYYVPLFRAVKQQKVLANPIFNIRNLIKAKSERYDYILDICTSLQRSNLFMLKFIKAENSKIIGRVQRNHKRNLSEKYLKKIYSELVEDSVYRYFGLDTTPTHDLFIPDDKLLRAEKFLKNSDKKIVIFNGEGSGNKSLYQEKIIESVKILSEDSSIIIYFLGYKSTKQKYSSIVDTINRDNVRITYDTDIYDAGALIKVADLVISVDTAIIHIASAMQTKVLEICGTATKSYTPLHPINVEYLTVEQKIENSNGGGISAIYETNCYDSDELNQKMKKLLAI